MGSGVGGSTRYSNSHSNKGVTDAASPDDYGRKCRESKVCPVIIRINKVLDDRKPKSVELAIKQVLSELQGMPEAHATRLVLKRLQEIGKS